MSLYSESYLDDLNRQKVNAMESMTGTGGTRSLLYQEALEKARQKEADLNQEGDVARQIGEFVSAPLIHEGIKGGIERLKTKAEKAIGDTVKKVVQTGKEYASEKLQPLADKLGVSADDIVNGNLKLKAPDLMDKAKGAMNEAYNTAKQKLAQAGGRAVGVEDPENAVKGLPDLDRATAVLNNKVKLNSKPLQEQAFKQVKAVKSKEQTLQDMAKRAERSQKAIRQRANQLSNDQETARINQSAEDRLARLRQLTSNPKLEPAKLDASDPDFLQRANFRMPSADNDARLQFLKENNPREYEDSTNEFRFKNVMGEDASEALKGYKAQADTFENRASFLNRTANRARLARTGQMAESRGVELKDQLKPMRDFMKARNQDLQKAQKLSDISENDTRAMGERQFKDVKSNLSKKLFSRANESSDTQKLQNIRDQQLQEQQLREASQARPQEPFFPEDPDPGTDLSQSAERTFKSGAYEVSNPSFDPAKLEHGENQLDPQNNPQSLSNTGGDSTQSLDTEGETAVETTKPPPANTKVTADDIGEDLLKSGTDAIETDAELGGPEDPLGDVISGVVGVSTLLSSLLAPHAKVQPPPLPPPAPPMLNPSSQMGVQG